MSTCDDLIEGKMEDRADQVEDLLRAIRGEEVRDDAGNVIDGEEASDALWELPLSVDRFVSVKILLSTGGPADWLWVTCSENEGGLLQIESVTYHFSDWFDHAEMHVESDSPLWELAERYVEAL